MDNNDGKVRTLVYRSNVFEARDGFVAHCRLPGTYEVYRVEDPPPPEPTPAELEAKQLHEEGWRTKYSDVSIQRIGDGRMATLDVVASGRYSDVYCALRKLEKADRE